MIIKESNKPGCFMLGMNDKEKFDEIKPKLDGVKIRNKLQMYFPKKAVLKIFDNFPKLTPKCSAGVQKEIDDIYKMKKRRVSNIWKIKSQYNPNGNSNIKFDYDWSRAKYPPEDHQKVMYNIIRYTNSGGLYADAGTMKTGPYLWAIDDYIKHGKVKKALIITLSGLKENVLAEMLNVQIPHRTGVVLRGGKTRCDNILNKGFVSKKKNKDYDIYIANYESMYNLIDLFDDNYFQLILCDEGHRLATYNSRMSESILGKFKNTAYKYIVTGSINANDIMSHHNPLVFLGEDNVPILHHKTAKNYYMEEVYERVWVERPGKREEVAKIIGNTGVEYKKEDVMKGLPKKLETERYVDMGKEQKRMTKELKENFIAKIKEMCTNCSSKNDCEDLCEDIVEGRNSLVVIGKLQQIANGFTQKVTKEIVNGKEKDKTVYIDIKENPKLKLLDDIVSEIGDSKIIIWSNRIFSLETIYNYLNKKHKNVNTLRIWGSDNAFKTVEEFKKDKNQFLVANPKKAGTGLNIQFSNYQITFDNSHSYTEYDQKVSRQYRGGQKSPVTVFRMCVRGSVDETVLNRLCGKKDLQIALGKYARMYGTLDGCI